MLFTGGMSQPPPQQDSAALLVSTSVHKYAIKKKKVLSPEETELFELTQAAGVTMDQEVFKIIVDLLKMNVAPQAVFQTLKAMCAGQRAPDCGTEAHTSLSTNSTTAPADAREEESCGKGPKALAALAPKAQRVGPKTVYGPQDLPHTAARGKTTLGEKNKETCMQKVQRQPSASRGQKTKSSGSSSSSSQVNST